MPDRLVKSQQSATKHSDHADQIKAAIRKDVVSLTTVLCRRLGLPPLRFAPPVERLANTFLLWILKSRLEAKKTRVQMMRYEMDLKTKRCCGCDMMPPAEETGWAHRPKSCKDGLLCDDCFAQGTDCWHKEHRNCDEEHTTVRRIDKYEARLPAISLAKAAVVAACLLIESQQMFYRLRFSEVCQALERAGFPRGKETVKRWEKRIRLVTKIPAPSLSDRIAGSACRLLLEQYASKDPRVREQDQEDLQLMAVGILRADAQIDQKKGEEEKKRTVQSVDGLLQQCLLNARLKAPEPLQRAVNPLHGRSERLVAAVLVYLHLRLRAAKNTTILDHRTIAGVDLQSFQACKAELVCLIDPVLWA